MSSADYFLALQELNLNGTLGQTTSTNPLNTTQSQNNNLEDANNVLRNSLIANINKILPFAIPTNVSPLSLSVSNSFLCWLRANNTEMNDLLNSWAEDMKFSFSNVSLLSDTDPTTNSQYMLFLEYVRQNTKRYFKRTKEYALMEHFLPRCEDSIIDVYFKFRKYYFDTVYKQLYNSLYNPLFSNGSNGWIDVARQFQQVVLLGFRGLNTGMTYGNFLNNYNNLCSQIRLFLQSTGPFGQFLTTHYAPQSFAGFNVCKFEDNIQGLMCKLMQVPGDTLNNSDLITYLFSSGGHNFPATDAFNTKQFEAFLYNNEPKSIVECLTITLVMFILHLLDKFVPASYTDPYFPPSPTDFIDQNGSAILVLLLEYIISGNGNSVTQPFPSIYNRFSKTCNLTDSELNVILGVPSFDMSGTYPIITGGILQYVSLVLETLLASSTDIVLFDPVNSESFPVSLPRLASGTSYFGGSFNIDWTTQGMTNSTVNNPPVFPLSLITSRFPQHVNAGNKLSLESVLIEMFDAKNLECVLSTYVCTYVNHIEGINIPSNAPYTSFVVTSSGSNITGYVSAEFKDFNVDYLGSSESHQSFRFLCDNCDCENVPKNQNIKCFKYYCIALVNYILHSIERNTLNITPTLILDDLFIPSGTLPLVAGNVYTYTSGSTDTQNIIQLLYMTQQWHTLLFNAFVGTGAYFDLNNLPDKTVCTDWSTTPLIQQLFYLFYKFDPCFLRLLVQDITSLSSANKSTENNLLMRTTNLERASRINN